MDRRQLLCRRLQLTPSPVEERKVEIGARDRAAQSRLARPVARQSSADSLRRGVEQFARGHGLAERACRRFGLAHDLGFTERVSHFEHLEEEGEHAFGLGPLFFGAQALTSCHRRLPAGSHHGDEQREHGQRSERNANPVAARELDQPIAEAGLAGQDRPVLEQALDVIGQIADRVVASRWLRFQGFGNHRGELGAGRGQPPIRRNCQPVVCRALFARRAQHRRRITQLPGPSPEGRALTGAGVRQATAEQMKEHDTQRVDIAGRGQG